MGNDLLGATYVLPTSILAGAPRKVSRIAEGRGDSLNGLLLLPLELDDPHLAPPVALLMEAEVDVLLVLLPSLPLAVEVDEEDAKLNLPVGVGAGTGGGAGKGAAGENRNIRNIWIKKVDRE